MLRSMGWWWKDHPWSGGGVVPVLLGGDVDPGAESSPQWGAGWISTQDCLPPPPIHSEDRAFIVKLMLRGRDRFSKTTATFSEYRPQPAHCEFDLFPCPLGLRQPLLPSPPPQAFQGLERFQEFTAPSSGPMSWDYLSLGG